MALKPKYDTNLVQLRESTSTAREAGKITLTTTTTWTGPYDLLLAKRNSLLATAKTTSISPEDAGHGTLTVVTEQVIEAPETPTADERPPDPPPVYEVLWQELRIPVEQHPTFKDLTEADHRAIEAALAGEAEAPTGETVAKLYALKRRGVTEYAQGVPVVRETTAGLSADPGPGSAWKLDNPPAAAAGPAGWKWMKTADEKRTEGATWTRTREWTGAKEWDETLYPD